MCLSVLFKVPFAVRTPRRRGRRQVGSGRPDGRTYAGLAIAGAPALRCLRSAPAPPSLSEQELVLVGRSPRFIRPACCMPLRPTRSWPPARKSPSSDTPCCSAKFTWDAAPLCFPKSFVPVAGHRSRTRFLAERLTPYGFSPADRLTVALDPPRT